MYFNHTLSSSQVLFSHVSQGFSLKSTADGVHLSIKTTQCFLIGCCQLHLLGQKYSCCGCKTDGKLTPGRTLQGKNEHSQSAIDRMTCILEKKKKEKKNAINCVIICQFNRRKKNVFRNIKIHQTFDA